jgi:hypothetical protein
MIPIRSLLLGAALTLGFGASPVRGFTLSFSSSDFGTTPVFSNVTTFAFDFVIAGPLHRGLYSDPGLSNIQYSVSGSLDATPSGFPAFGFALNHRFPGSPPGPITGAEFYALNGSAVPGQTLRFEVSPSADLSDGLQIDELVDLGGGVVFRFNGREEGTGRYHPAFIELNSDGTGRIQNADNMGGDNPQDGSPDEIDVAFGEEYITDLTFNPVTFTIGVPEPGVSSLLLCTGLLLALGRRRR